MKRLIVPLIIVFATVGFAIPGPIIRVEQTWETGLVLEAGLATIAYSAPEAALVDSSIRLAALELYVGKSDPFIINGWYTIGAGFWCVTNYAPHFSIGGGLRFLVETVNWRITAAAWSFYLEGGWWWGPFEAFIRLNYFLSIVPDKPLGNPMLSIGFTVDLARLLGGEAW